MKKTIILTVCSILLSFQLVNAQQKTITGTVTSSDSEVALPGVTVVVKGTTIGTLTNADGHYSIDVPEDAKALVFSYVGMLSKEISIGANTIIDAVLEPDMVGVDEVIVVAYGTSKKSSFTGAASIVKGENIAKMQTSNLSKALEGNVAGVQVVSNSGQPGDGASIIIRGIGSISASKQPLIVVDGVPYEGSLNSISPHDIESMTVLKDAAANSMYGARGSNGVIMITTKKGEVGKIKLNFDARVGVNTRGIPTYNIITEPGDYYEMTWEALRNYYEQGSGYSRMEANGLASENLISGYLQYNVFKNVEDNNLVNPLTGKLNENATGKKWGNEWSEEPFDNGVRQDYNLSISGGSDKTTYYTSFGYLNDEGYIDGSEFERYSARLKLDQEVTSFLKFGGNIGFSQTNQNIAMDPDNLTAYSNIFSFTQQIAPIYPVYLYDIETGELELDENDDKQYDFGTENSRPYASEINPVSTNRDNLNEYLRDNLSSRAYIELKFLKNFIFTANIAYDLFNRTSTEYMTPNGGDAEGVGGRAYKYATRYSVINTNQLLAYKNEFSNHEINALVGHEIKADKYKLLYGHMTNFINSDNAEFGNATVYQNLTSYTNEYKLEGYFGRLEYDYNDKYYLTAGYRYDGSSRFAPDVRWGSFWAVGASWRISQENFMSGMDFFDNLKIKTSYGTQGNDNILDEDGYTLWYAYQDLYEIERVDGEAAMNLILRGNEDLTWEKSKNFNLGIETVLIGRITLNAAFFIKKIDDMLYKSPLAASLGNPTYIWRNEMDMKNTGFEFDLGVDVIKTKDITWNVSLNGIHYKNELTRLPEDKDQDGYQSGNYWRNKGGTVYDWYTYEYVGVDQQTGLPQYNSYDDEGEISLVNESSDASLREIGKTPIPDLTGGIASSITAYGFDFSVQTVFQIGGYIWDDSYQDLMGNDIGENMHKDMFKRWTSTNTDTDVPLLYAEDTEINTSSDRWLTKASYFNIRNITLGYTFPKAMLQKVSISSLRIYAVADNVWLKSKRKGLDPRQTLSGSNFGFVYSNLRAVSLGISLSL